MVRGRSQDCERTRASVSAALDGELSELESLRVRTHLNGCDVCREFEASAQFSTTALRAAPLEPLTRPIALPSRRKRALGVRVPSAAAAAVLMVAFGGVFETLHGGAAKPSTVAFDNRQDMLSIAKRQKQAEYQLLLARRAQFESNQIRRRAGFQNP
jgi:predicted anti-sigma-YlaC factor YlaD